MQLNILLSVTLPEEVYTTVPPTFRQRANRLQVEGASQRRNWSPSAGSLSLRIYQYWLSKSRRGVPVENFCHFWRVVLIWAPLRWLAKPLVIALAVVFGLAAVTGIGLLAFYHLQKLLAIVGTLAAVVYMYGGLMFGGVLVLTTVFPDEDLRNLLFGEWIRKSSFTTRAILGLACLPFVLLWIALATLVLPLVGLQRDHKFFSRAWYWVTGARPSSRKPFVWLRPWEVLPAVLIVTSVWFVAARVILVIVVGVVFLSTLILLFGWMVDRRRERRKALRASRERAIAVRNVMLDEQLVPVSDTAPQLAQPKGKPALIADFFVFLWSIVLTKKWMICPIVEIPQPE